MYKIASEKQQEQKGFFLFKSEFRTLYIGVYSNQNYIVENKGPKYK